MPNQYHCLDLSDILNNRGVTPFSEKDLGNLSIGGASFPNEHMPVGYAFEFIGIPFIMMNNDGFDNIEVEGQCLIFPPMKPVRIHILGLSNNSHMTEEIHFEQGGVTKYSGRMQLTNFISDVPSFDNQCAIRAPYLHFHGHRAENFHPAVWYHNITADPAVEIDSIRFGDNPCIHLFSITVEEHVTEE